MGKSIFTLSKSVEDLTPISAAREALAKGDEPQTTPTNRNANLSLPIKNGENYIELIYPDYGGEQIDRIIASREIDQNWIEAINKCNNWLFFIRLNSLNKPLDLSSVTVTENHLQKNNIESDQIHTPSDQSALIELLQIFLHIKGHDFHSKNSNLKLTVVLTCWDELETESQPSSVFSKDLPLLLDFLESNWERDTLKVVGLAAQGFSLNLAENKEKFLTEGPENFGYFIRANGERTDDLTELLLEAL
ncbi:hypothetical protein LEP1GSC151_0261 [Leptospira interrogans serovar Grippotyphosa str. LT2186]|nr:hypothetical protein LEP1GSC080_0079 [Leptospira interrogans str. FPW2026]EMG11190.1 hypothetical protein LEP1GSC151_0261 [Leptospira interrogans serovar Grippotyphosa str. LT2186]EMN84650.1 hypothetical protein LEP1GSC107_0599 [Leptospira interrogans serovar Grippotyphosa str. UI 12769]